MPVEHRDDPVGDGLKEIERRNNNSFPNEVSGVWISPQNTLHPR
jgi:hypothetical protein